MQLDTVLVTARRREEALQDVPQSVTAISGAELEARGAQDIAALGDVTPNLTIYPARAFNGTVTAFIRGIGQADPIWSVEPGVGVYVDDVYLARPQGALLDILDVERVEVLRGPQGTLYGKNTLGGAIKLVTRDPAATLSGTATLTAGDYGRRDGKLVLNLPLGDRLRTRLALGTFDRNGFGRNLFTGAEVSARDTRVARFSATWAPTTDMEVRLAWDRTIDDSGPQGFKRLAVNPTDPAGTRPDPGDHDVRSGAPNVQRLNSGGGSITLDWNLGMEWRLRAISAWRSGDSLGYIDFDTLPATINQLERHFADRQTSQEIQLHWNDGRAHAVAGLYLFDGDSGGVGINSSRSPLFGYTSSTIGTRSAALYANLTQPIGYALELDVGLRYTVERKTATVLNRTFADAALSVPFNEPSADFTDAATFSAPSPRVVLAWRPTTMAMLYAQASRGFKGGSYNIGANPRLVPRSAHAVDDEAVTALELGAKSAWLDDRLSVDVALFHNSYRDIQLSVFTSYDGDGDGSDDRIFRDFRNAGDGTTRGAELEWRMRAGYLRWTGQVGYLDARYNRYIDEGLDIAANRRFSNAPRWTAGSSVVADLPLRVAGTLRARIDGRYQSKVWQTGELVDELAQEGYALWNASLAWTSPAQGWQVALHGNNLGGVSYRTTGFAFPTLGILTGHYGPPRTFALTVTRTF
ncbi:MAG: TonB-dependent receptor [Thermomonas sp.]